MTEQGDDIFLTGATGFVGSHILHALLVSGFRVRALRRPQSRPLPAVAGCREVQGDVRRPGDLARSMDGCRYLVHVAALYTFAPGARRDIYRTNVEGCAGLLEAARIAGIERAVVTSSSATVGPARDGHPATEDDWAKDSTTNPNYHNSKLAEERVALAAPLPAVVLLPTAPVGPGDWKPTPTGKMVVDFMRGRMFASLGGGLNLVAVEDVARAHVAALRRGRAGERYLIGGENLSLNQVWTVLAGICGRKPPTRRLPYHAALALAWADELRCRLSACAVPLVPLEGVHMARYNMYVTSEKARAELDYRHTPVVDALVRAVRWYRENGYAA